MMRIVQHPYECLLASLCMLTHRNYATARSTFKHTYGKDWQAATAREMSLFAASYFAVRIDPKRLSACTPPELCTHAGNRIALVRYALSFQVHAIYVDAANRVYDPFPVEPIEDYEHIRFNVVAEIRKG